MYAPDGTIVADSQSREGQDGQMRRGPPAAADRSRPGLSRVGEVYDHILSLLPHATPVDAVDMTPRRARAGLAAGREGGVAAAKRRRQPRNAALYPPHRATTDFWITVAEPVERDKRTVGIVLLTREAREVEDSLFTVRVSIIALFGLALALTVLLSWYLSLTIARPILRLADAASDMREGKGRTGSVSESSAGAA